jgi:hypothetical protein
MIILERVTGSDWPGVTWTDDVNAHVIVLETDETVRVDILMEPGWYLRDEDGETGPWPSLDDALTEAEFQWGDAVALGPCARLVRDLHDARPGEGALRQLVEHLADYGPGGIDVQALAELVLRKEEWW